MFNHITPLLESLFSSGPGQPIEFEWWLICRNGQPFLLLPTSPAEAHIALELYSAQRKRAKILRALLPLFLKTPASVLLPRVRIRVDSTSELARFMAQQSGVPADRLCPPAIKIGGLALDKARFVMLLCDAAKRPVKVIKVGMNPNNRLGLHPDGWKTTEQEANQLALLPSDLNGCIQMTGRIATPQLTAFATTFFSGDSPRDDEGMEQLFHSWLNPQAPVPVESLFSWQELEAELSRTDPQLWQALSAPMRGKKIHSTIQHGDFAPWNIRATSQQNLQVFDWERSQMQGIPAWDWFHFFVQTAILARRCSEKRVAAEVEQLLQSPRFQIYAAAARITPIVKPLFLAYLLHQKLIVKPLEGRQTTERLYELLAAHWKLDSAKPMASKNEVKPAKSRRPSLLASIGGQLGFALVQLSDLIWEPTLTRHFPPKLAAQFRAHWKMIFFNSLFLAAVIGINFYTNAHKNIHLSFIPFYLLPCVWLALALDRRWAALLATVAAAVPMMHHLQDPALLPLDLALWNMVMRFILFQIIVLLADRIRNYGFFFATGKSARSPTIKETFSNHWAVIIGTGIFFAGVAAFDCNTSPQLNLLPLYLLPCMILTLVVDRRWGAVMAVIAAVTGPFVMRFEDAYYRHFMVEFWNTLARLLIFELVVWLLDRICQENVLFAAQKSEEQKEVFFKSTSDPNFLPLF